MIKWINSNKEWFLSGLRGFLLIVIYGIVKWLIDKKEKHSKRIINMNGDKSIYIEKNDGEINMK